MDDIMKYILKEAQLERLKKINLLESIIPLWIRRRLSSNNIESYIHNALLDFPTLCNDFPDEFEYADNVISRAIDDFLTSDEDLFDTMGEDYDEIHSYVTDLVKDWFGEYLLELYRNTCAEHDD